MTPCAALRRGRPSPRSPRAMRARDLALLASRCALRRARRSLSRCRFSCEVFQRWKGCCSMVHQLTQITRCWSASRKSWSMLRRLKLLPQQDIIISRCSCLIDGNRCCQSSLASENDGPEASCTYETGREGRTKTRKRTRRAGKQAEC